MNHLYEWICTTLAECVPLLGVLDATWGIRRMQQPKAGTFTNCLSFGRLTKRPAWTNHPGIWSVTLTFTPYCRTGQAVQGDRLIEDIINYLDDIFEYHDPKVVDPSLTPYLCVMDTGHDGFESEPEFLDPLQAWRKSVRYRFLVSLPICKQQVVWCELC